jgi:hypothetical protein
MKKIFLCTPAYDGKVNVQYAISLAETVMLLSAHGIQVQIKLSAGSSLLVAERNRLTEAFMETDCTHMLCVDSDLGWPAEAVKSMLDKDEEFIAGVYPARKNREFTFRPVFNPDYSVVKSEKNLLEMAYVPAGFMLIKRSAIEKMRSTYPDLYFEPKYESSNASKGYCFFNTEVWNGEFWGEDYYFCRKAREAGIRIWVDPLIQFDHNGVVGMLVEALTDDPNKCLKM